jgi:hypothetical protein
MLAWRRYLDIFLVKYIGTYVHVLSHGIVSACAVMGREIESQQVVDLKTESPSR